MSNPVTYSLEEGVATLTLDDGKANALSLDTIAAINSALDRAEQEAKALLITGKAGVLSAGFDLRVIESDPAGAKEMATRGGELLVRIFMFPMPVVMASTGHAVGAGALLLLTADYRLGGDADCKIVLNEAAMGFPLPGFGVELARARLVNTAIAQTVLCSQVHNTASASEVGFIDEVVAEDKLLAAAFDKAKELSQMEGKNYAAIKHSFRTPVAEKIAAYGAVNLGG